MNTYRYKIEVKGTVQGIGFRPFVYKEALKHSLAGHVYNHSSGVTIEAQGKSDSLTNFIKSLQDSHPPFADIHSIEHQKIEAKPDANFRILESKTNGSSQALISTDLATCDKCLNDISDPGNRRFSYPFTNCTNCGPRYTIIEGVPYDRHLTAMKSFDMCSECRAEYNDPLDRRYHAQPNCCPICGPNLQITNGKTESSKEIIHEAARLLNEGKIVAIKGLGGFHLACDATNNEAVTKLRERKHRDEKPFAVMMPDAKTVRNFCELSNAEERILTSAQRPIVLLRKHSHTIHHQHTEADISPSVAPNNCYLGVMLPYTPLHHLLFSFSCNVALVMTSANISDEPICYHNDEATERLKDIADYFLFHDRDIYIRTDDSITRVMDDKPLMIRRARGYAPQPIILTIPKTPGKHRPDILATGAELKNSVCLLKDNKAFISQHIGDLKNTASYESFEKTIEHLQNIYDINPTIIAHDMHPDYFSTRWANSYHAKLGGGAEEVRGRSHCTARRSCAATGPTGVELIKVQHHHAHIASCMAENGISGPVIGIALDGTGYGTDGNIWGGEILVASYKEFERAGQFEYVAMPGGEAAIKNPWMMGLAYLKSLNADSKILNSSQSFKKIPDDKIELVLKMIDKEINSPLTSSCGRLFDAVAAILGIRHAVSFEGQAALELEMLASSHLSSRSREVINPYAYSLHTNNHYITISYRPTLKGLLEDLKNAVSGSEIALKFHYTIVAALTEATLKISKNRKIDKIALSGGCFQNLLLARGLKKALESAGMKVYTHSLVPPNDGGISLGQAAIAMNGASKCV
jgi:hydrogenase maturation protein HypF